ncbi:MAG: tetratricopeptide repeat protein [Planctomycetaceae bacterium]
MNSEKFALISATGHVAAMLSDKRDGVTLIGCDSLHDSRIPTSIFTQAHPDFAVVPVQDESDAIAQLDHRNERCQCLDMVLFLFDSELDSGLRQEIAVDVDSMLQLKSNQEYVLDLLFASPLPVATDIEGARLATINTTNVKGMVNEIIAAQDIVRILFESWAAMMKDPVVQQVDPKLFHGALVRCGVFRQMAQEIEDGRPLSEVQSHITFNSELNSQFSVAPRVLSRWIERIRSTWPALAQQSSRRSNVRTDDSREPRKSLSEPRVIVHQTDHRAYLAAIAQVDRIVELFKFGNDSAAHSMLNQLIQNQLANEDGESYAVKSLCNVASKVEAAGRTDVSAHCLETAMGLENGVDCRAYNQLGTLLRDFRRFGDAERAYDRAEQLANGSIEDIVAIRRARTHIHTLTFDYQRAIDEYRELCTHLYSEEDRNDALTAIGDLYRKLGLLNEAKDYYRKAPYIHRAQAGLAETYKQEGKIHRAISEYNRLFAEFGELGPYDESFIVYKTAYAHLLRMVGQDDKAKRLLLDLYAKNPLNSAINYELYVLCKLRKPVDKNEIKKYQDGITRNRLTRDREEILDRIIHSVFDETAAPDFRESSKTVPPEMMATLACASALSNLLNSRSEDAIEVLRGASAVDRSIDDWSRVLTFHAASQFNPSQSMDKMDQRLYLIRKRGNRLLREAINSICRFDFGAALVLESEFLLRVAC